ncbi:MAG: acyl-ACP--UDP-N-acetylglucosamine O-acyltransferase [Planctomycetes bacterium]|nr:acyl-ACP--UDP-N-acetylglucosamine O-acyltransferase [Planctomycetota bacterium]
MPAANVSDLSQVHPLATVAEDVEIGPFTVIGPKVRIGRGCRIANNVTITGDTSLGEFNRVFPGAVLGTEPQDLKYVGELSYLEIGDHNTIREFATINTGTEANDGRTIVGNNNLLMSYVHVAHDCVLGDSIIVSSGAMMAGHVEVLDHAVIGGGAGVHHFATIGRHAFVSAMSGLRTDAPPFLICEGVPAKVRGVNVVGMKRHGHTHDQVAAVKETFRILYRSNSNFRDAVKELEDLCTVFEEVREIVDFLERMEQGRKGRFKELTRPY